MVRKNTFTPNPVSERLDLVAAHLRAERPGQALELLPVGSEDPALDNARGVCLMRLGRAREAIAVFRRLALRGETTDLDRSRPTVIHTNFATALLLDRNVTGCLKVLAELREDANPTGQRLRDFIDRWQGGLGWWRRLMFRVYGDVPALPVLDFAPGELLLPGSDSPRRAA